MSYVVKIKHLCSVQDPVKRLKTRAAGWEKTFTEHAFALCPKCAKNSQPDSKKTSAPSKWTEDLNAPLSPPLWKELLTERGADAHLPR